MPLTLSIIESSHTQGRVQSDRHVQVCDHSVVSACTSVLQVTLAPPAKDMGPAAAGLQPLAAAPWMVPAHLQSDSVMKDTEGIKYHITWKSALVSHSTFFLDFSARFLSKSPFSAACNRQHGELQYLIHWSLIGEETSWELSLLGSILVSDAPPAQSLQPQPLLIHPEVKLVLGMRKTWPFFLLAFPCSTCCKPVLAEAKLDQ